ncbi:MAG: tannase/feruloyl esterase family alpha/beta hydrolase [Bryobacteraceae bacterium]
MKPTLVLFAATTIAAWAQAPNKCAQLGQFKSPGLTLEITRAEMVAPGQATGRGGAPTGPVLPAHCRVNGTIDKRTGPDGKLYGIKFAIAMPDNWSSQYLQQGGGGLNGTVAEPTGTQFTGTQPAIVRGFAVATTDTGHVAAGGGGFDGSFMQDQQAALDFEYIANGRVAVLAKQIIETYYAKPIAHSYFIGCSTGGREAMLMTQRYPLYFDGVVAGAPAMRTGHSNLATKSVTVALNSVGGLTDPDRQAIITKLADTCDARDGIKDGMIFDVTGCNFTPASLQCTGAKADGCLSAAQAAALTKAFAGPKDSRGNQVYPGFFFDTGITATGGGIPGLIATGTSPLGAPTKATTQDIDAEARTVDSNPVSRIGDSYSWTNLSSFSAHGGKLLFVHGVSDPWFSAKDTIDYYQRMSTANGGEAKVRDWSRLFLSPGMGHCGGGSATLDTFDLLTSAVNWVEKGTAPDAVTATGRAFPNRSRPLCAYPAHAQYKGTGDPESAASFDCKQ